jgi:small subunit ribosomal protein S5
MSENNENFLSLVHVARTAKVVTGGRRFSFAAIVVAGNKNGMVGMGTGKASEVLEANKKAENEAKKSMIRIPLKEGRTIHHDVVGKFGSGLVKMRSAPPGTGNIAPGPIRTICEALGIKDIVVKSLGSSNPHNMIKAALDALKNTCSPKYISDKRGKKVGEIISRRESKVK